MSEWKTGSLKPTSFSADAYLDVYHEHMVLMKCIKNKNPAGFHTMMHRLYNAAR